jgi:hypothetical protein
LERDALRSETIRGAHPEVMKRSSTCVTHSRIPSPGGRRESGHQCGVSVLTPDDLHEAVAFHPTPRTSQLRKSSSAVSHSFHVAKAFDRPSSSVEGLFYWRFRIAPRTCGEFISKCHRTSRRHCPPVAAVFGRFRRKIATLTLPAFPHFPTEQQSEDVLLGRGEG